MSHSFLSCDWGTSSFRLRWVEGTRIVREYRDQSGCKSLYDRATETGARRPAVYAEFLTAVLERWHGFAPASPIPLVISGMASSTIGWLELPYARVPIALNASNLNFERLDWPQPPWISETFLISGVATDRDIMRGEETEAIGLLADPSGDGLLILPGTHSKHLSVQSGEITGFCTFMTGELFDVLTRHSILKATTQVESIADSSHPHLPAFEEGVREGASSGLGASLFQTRARSVLHRTSAAQNTWFLSGLLIGAEVAEGLKRHSHRSILLGGTGNLRTLYAQALKTLEMSGVKEIDDAQAEQAVPRAHSRFLQCRL